MKNPFRSLFRALFAAAALLCAAQGGYAHSGKARFHMIIDTDGAADDLRTLCMLLGNREAEVLCIVTSDGALAPRESALRVAALLNDFRHEGIPVGAGRASVSEAPPWRTHAQQVDWGDLAAAARDFPPAAALVAETLENEDEKVVYVALGALTNVRDMLQQNPELGARIERIVWYNSAAEPLAGANFEADPEAACSVLASGVPVAVVSAHPAHPVFVTETLLDSLAAVPTPYARKIVGTHRTAPLAELLGTRHMEAWDDLAAAYLYAPELFACRKIGPTAEVCTPADGDVAERVDSVVLAVLRGKPDAESRVFYGFPVQRGLYAADVVPIIDSAVARYGASEWRAGVLTNELHGHLGIYAIVGVKMGIRAREYFNIGVDDIRVTTFAGHKPPVSCMNDGLQVGTGASVGHGLIEVAQTDAPRPEALFCFKGKTLRLALKPEYARRIRDDVRRGIELYGDLTEPYWQYVRELALRYWLEFDRHEIFDMTPMQ